MVGNGDTEIKELLSKRRWPVTRPQSAEAQAELFGFDYSDVSAAMHKTDSKFNLQ